MDSLRLLYVWVPGRPRTKGSLEPVNMRAGRAVLADKPESVAWRRRVAELARQEWGGKSAFPFAVVVRLTSYFVSDDGDPTQHSLGDTDKLQRLVGDALAVDKTGKGLGAAVIEDDDQIVCWVADKVCGAADAKDTRSLASQGMAIAVYRAPYAVGRRDGMDTHFSAGLTAGLVGALDVTSMLSGVTRESGR